MAITDTTRKRLWGQSGLRCAYCRAPVVEQATATSANVLVGEECHIRARSLGGPRYDARIVEEVIDSIDNLLILCATHHKLVDTDTATFTVERLLEIKRKHERWVEECLSYQAKAKEGLPQFLTRITTGKELLNMLSRHDAMRLAHDEPTSAEEAEIIAEFAQNLQDWADVVHDLDSGSFIRTAFDLSGELTRLASAGFWLFGAASKRTIKSPRGPILWRESVLAIHRTTNPDIISVDLSEKRAPEAPAKTM